MGDIRKIHVFAYPLPLSPQKQGSYNPQKVVPSGGGGSYGSGRPVPIKEGAISKKSQGLRGEWKKKYLVLTSEEIMYYPSFQDYMTMSHGKSFKLQQIGVKWASHRVTGTSMSRVATTPPSNHYSGSEFTDSLPYTGHQSDRSNSQSPPPGMSSSLDVSYNSTTSGLSNIRIMGPEPDGRYGSRDLEQSREFRSPLSPGLDEFGSSDQFEKLRNYGGPTAYRYEGGVVNGRGHARNGSFDDNTMLKQLRSGGNTFDDPLPTIV